MQKDATWKPPPPALPVNLPSSKYLMVNKESLVQLLSRCNKCPSGVNSLVFTEAALALQCKCTCASCGEVYVWENSPVLKTATASPKEKLREINLDMVMGSSVTAVGTAVSNFTIH